MAWDTTPNAGFTSGEPWLEVVVPADGPASEQREGSMLDWYRSLIALRRDLEGELELLDAGDDVVAFRRGAHVVALNLGAADSPAPAASELVIATPGTTAATLAPGGAFVALG
jgi:glycosidase